MEQSPRFDAAARSKSMLLEKSPNNVTNKSFAQRLETAVTLPKLCNHYSLIS